MYRLKDLAKQCEFTNSDEIVKFLLLIHNKHSEVKQELLKCVQKETTLSQCLEYTRSVEGNLQSVELSRYIDKIPQPNNNAEVRAVNKKFKQKCDKCGLKHKPKECPAFGKQCYKCGKDNHHARLCRKAKKAEIDFEPEFDTVNIQECDQYDDSKWYMYDEY